MGLANALGGYVTPRGRENLPAWGAPRRGRYEAWYLTLNAPDQGAAFWLRYTLDAPDHGDPHAELWGHVFDAREPARSFGLRRRWPLAQLELGGERLVRIGDAALAEGRATGALDGAGHELSWDLGFAPSPRALFMMPRGLRGLISGRATNWCVPNPDVRYQGRVTADGRTFDLASAPGQQAHLFGRRHAEAWAWLHCNAFDGDRRAVVEAVCATVALGGSRRDVTLVYVHHAGKDYLGQALPGALRNRSERELPEFRFGFRAGGLAFSGRARGDPAKMLQVAYEDPDGTPSYCCNSELADLSLEIRKGTSAELLVATGTAHLEFGGRDRNEALPVCPLIV
ncbi:MAG TPA: tocopherol cyclase family protein [Myxococcales bacterium]|nr:tocopherol cyclase family protein [Myxococcales bacterium]